MLRGEYTPSRELEIGKAAEHLVCADLLLKGYSTFLSDQGLPYDVVVDFKTQLLRVQVKGTLGVRNLVSAKRTASKWYCFNLRRKSLRGVSPLTVKDCDIVALVALDIRHIAYVPVHLCPQTLSLMPPGHVFKKHYSRKTELTIDQHSFEKALSSLWTI